MPLSWPRLLRIALTFSAAGWLGGGLVIAEGVLADLPGALVQVEALRCAVLAGALGGIIGGPLALMERWVVSASAGPAAGLLTLLAVSWLYFYLWPPTWDVPTWKAAAVVLNGYWAPLVPLAMIAGALAGATLAIPLRRAAWQRLPHEPEESEVLAIPSGEHPSSGPPPPIG